MAVNTMTATTTGVLTTLRVQATQFVWTGTGAIGDQIVVKDSTGRIIFQATALSAQYEIGLVFRNGDPQTVNGINITTLSSGTLIVYHV